MSTISPRIRRQARERALQFLFGIEFTKYQWEPVIDAFWKTNPSRPGVKRYARWLIQGVMENLGALDADIERTVDNWSPERIGRVERNVLRIALYEMRHAADVPSSVAINEAIEIVKRFGADDAPRFINGVLDRLKENEPRTNNS